MLIRRTGEDSWRTPSITNFTDERALQMLLEKSPGLLPGANSGQMRVVNELPVALVGYVDLVGVDTDGNITIVECKLKANPEIRRQVVGQVLAYAAGLWGMTYEAFDQAFTTRAGAPLAQHMNELGLSEWNEEVFRANVAANLSSGRMRLIIAVDEITPELKRIVQYLNQHTADELQILALELGYVADEGVEILVPTTYGEESSQNKTTGTQRKWDEAGVFAALEKCCSEQGVKAARRLYEWSRAQGASYRWGGGALPSVTARFPIEGNQAGVFSLYEWSGKGLFALNFEYIRNYVSTAQLTRLADHLRNIPGVREAYKDLEQSEYKVRPGLAIDGILTQPGAVETIINAIMELIADPMPPQTPTEQFYLLRHTSSNEGA